VNQKGKEKKFLQFVTERSCRERYQMSWREKKEGRGVEGAGHKHTEERSLSKSQSHKRPFSRGKESLP